MVYPWPFEITCEEKKMNAARVNAVKTDPSTQKRTAKLWWKSTQ